MCMTKLPHETGVWFWIVVVEEEDGGHLKTPLGGKGLLPKEGSDGEMLEYWASNETHLAKYRLDPKLFWSERMLTNLNPVHGLLSLQSKKNSDSRVW